MSIASDWRFTVADANGSPTHELVGVTFQGFAQDGFEPIERPRLSHVLRDEIVRQSFAGQFDMLSLKKAAPNHQWGLWLEHQPEMPFLGEERIKNMCVLNARGSRRAVIEFPSACCWSTLQLRRHTLLLYQRSLDLWKGAPYDWSVLRAIALYCGARRVVWHVGSAHLYEENLRVVESFLKEE